jgi:hypothetical protein
VNSKRLLLALAVLSLGFGIYRLGRGEPVRDTLQRETAAGAIEQTKTSRRDDPNLSLDGGASLKIERALERSSQSEALEGFRELIQAQGLNQAEEIEFIRRSATVGYEQDPRFIALEDRSRELSGRINIAQATMLQHDVDPEAIWAIIAEHRKRASKLVAIRELQEMDTAPVTKPPDAGR